MLSKAAATLMIVSALLLSPVLVTETESGGGGTGAGR